MSGLWWVLIFGVAYPLIALAVACMGVFGISASRHDLVERARSKNNERWPGTRLEGYQISAEFSPLIVATFFAAIFWPVGIPIYLAWKKGSVINDALTERAKLMKEAS